MDTFVILKLLSNLVLPPASLLLGLLVGGLLAILGWRRLGRFVVVLVVAQLLLFSLPPVSDALIGGLEAHARAEAALAKPCCYEAIVVLGGGVAPAYEAESTEPNLTEGADRVWATARLYHRGVAPHVIVSGTGFPAKAGRSSMSEAEAMRIFLIDLGVPAKAIIDEAKARNTIENIAFVRDIVGNKPVALVTSAYHMPRSLRLARQMGLNASAFPTDWSAPFELRPVWENWIPTIAAMSASSIALREMMALVFDRRAAGARS